MVGEIRDGETAELAVHAALTGHLVLSTLHTNSASGALPRLLDMGVESFLLSSTLNAVLAQRLVRKVCADCKQETDAPESIRDDIYKVIEQVEANKVLMTKDVELARFVKTIDKKKVKLYHGAGCNRCANTGYRGRLGIYELLAMSDALAHAIVGNNPANVIEKISTEEGMLTLLQDGYLRVVEGSTTLEEVMRVAK